MTNYISEIRRQFRDKYNMVPSGGTDQEPIFENIPDGVYPMEIEGKMDNVEISGNKIKCCNFVDEPQADKLK